MANTAVSDANLAQSLDYTQNPSALAPALQNIFDTISVQVISDRNGSGTYDTGEPVINTGDMRMVDVHDRRCCFTIRFFQPRAQVHLPTT